MKGNGRGLMLGTIVAFAWSEKLKPREPLDKITSLLV
jgi:hypothetical protein